MWKIIYREIPVIKGINIEGNKLISKAKIKEVFIFKEGENFKEGYLDKAKSDIISFYSRKGFPLIGIMGLGIVSVNGLRRVPLPPAKITACLSILIFIAFIYGNNIYSVTRIISILSLFAFLEP